jgi:hypothetical protein
MGSFIGGLVLGYFAGSVFALALVFVGWRLAAKRHDELTSAAAPAPPPAGTESQAYPNAPAIPREIVLPDASSRRRRARHG